MHTQNFSSTMREKKERKKDAVRIRHFKPLLGTLNKRDDTLFLRLMRKDAEAVRDLVDKYFALLNVIKKASLEKN